MTFPPLWAVTTLTAPVWASFWAISHADIRSDIKALTNFLSVNNYPRQQSVLQAELGSTDEVRWVKTTQAYKSDDVPPIYSNFILGANAYGCVSIDETSMEMIIKPLGAGEDPLNQKQSLGWKGRLGCTVLDDSWCVNLRCTKNT